MTTINTARAYDTTIETLQKRQLDLSDAQDHLSAGKRVLRASDDPAAAGRAERALASISRIDASKRSAEASQTRMTLTESALGDAGDLLQQARELMVSAGNASYGPAERKAIGTQIASIRQQLFAVANRSDGGSGYLFGGQGTQTPPFLDGTGGVSYIGDGGQMKVGGSDNLPITMDGNAAWLAAPTGNGVFETKAIANTGSGVIDAGSVTNASAYYAQPPSTYDVTFGTNPAGATTYSITRTPNPPAVPTATTVVNAAAFTPGQAIQVDGMSFTISGTPAQTDHFSIVPSTSSLNVFDMLDQAAANLSNGNLTATQVAQTNAQNLTRIDSSMSRLQLARSDAGNALNIIDGANDRLDNQKLLSETDRSNAEQLDMVAAISDFQTKQNGYDAALKSYSMVQKLSLFQYLNA
jgi:flagellar hook-associated protein 3 FlgL